MDAIFLGADALAPNQVKAITLHSLTDELAPPVTLVDVSAGGGTGGGITSAAVSPDSVALCLGDNVGWLAVYDVVKLRAEPLSPPRHEARLGAAIAGVAFSDDGGRLLMICISGPVEVRDARAEGLSLLRTLAFRGPQSPGGTCILRCAGGLAVAVGGGIADIAPDAESRRAGVWRLSANGEEAAATLELTAFATAAAVRGDGGQVAIGGTDGAVRLFGGEGWAQSAELAKPGDGTRVRSLAYTPDGWRLVVGRMSGTFVVYDVGSGAAVGHFVEGKGNIGRIAAIAPGGDVAAVGGGLSRVVTLRELAPPVPLHRWAMGGAGAVADTPVGTPVGTLAGAAAVGDIVALAVGNRLEVHSRGGAWPPLALELDAAIAFVILSVCDTLNYWVTQALVTHRCRTRGYQNFSETAQERLNEMPVPWLAADRILCASIPLGGILCIILCARAGRGRTAPADMPFASGKVPDVHVGDRA
jgi:hypothetical protein